MLHIKPSRSSVTCNKNFYIFLPTALLQAAGHLGLASGFSWVQFCSVCLHILCDGQLPRVCSSHGRSQKPKRSQITQAHLKLLLSSCLLTVFDQRDSPGQAQSLCGRAVYLSSGGEETGFILSKN